MSDQDNKAKAFFILNDANVIEEAVVRVLERFLTSGYDNASQMLYMLMRADQYRGGYVLNNAITNNLQSRSTSPLHEELRDIIRVVVKEELAQLPNHIEERIKELKRMEMQNRYNKWR